MATIKQNSDGGPDGTTLGQSSSDLISFHGVPPVDQGVFIPVTVTVSTSVLASRVLSLIAMLAEKGICASA
jgi:hypothetical protein